MPYMAKILQGARGFFLQLSIMAGACAALLAATACGSEGAPSSREGLPPAETLLARSAQAMAQVRSIRFSLTNENGETPLPDGLALRSAKGSLVHPDKMEAQFAARVAGFPVELKVISANDRTYVTNPLTGRWQTYDYALGLLAFLDAEKGLVQIMRSMSGPVVSAGPATDGAETYRVKGSIPATSVAFMTTGALEGARVDVDILIGARDSLMREAKLFGRISEGEPPGMSRVLELSSFNQTFAIAAPQ